GTSGAFGISVVAANINSDGVPGVGGALDQDFALVVYNGNATLAVLGACCDGAGGCSLVTQSACQSAGGTYNSDNSACSAPSCVGRCCSGTGVCSVTGLTACTSAGGSYAGNGTDCGTISYTASNSGNAFTDISATGTLLFGGAIAPTIGNLDDGFST